MSEISPNQWTILERLEKGPEWIRSFQPAKPLLDDLIEKGLIERCRPHLGRGRNMVRLTEAGCEELEVAASDIPANRERAVFVDKPRSELGQIKPGISHKVRSVCERFVHAINGGEPQSDVIEQLAAAEDVQRPAIWKSCDERSGKSSEPHRRSCRPQDRHHVEVGTRRDHGQRS
jgi:DNA-binding MarR family transcriptional regulator